MTGVAHRAGWWRTASNLGQHTLSLMVSWWLLSVGGVIGVPTGAPPPDGGDLVVVAVAALSYFLISNGFVWVALALLRRQQLLETIREDAVFQLAVHMTLVGLAPLVAVVMAHRWQLLPLFLLRLLAIRGNVESLDDFGTGYSSLVLLKRLPLQEIKVDRSFVKRLGEDTGPDEADTIVRSFIDLGHSLGMSVVAEGVETWASLERLRSFGCDRAQGWHLSPALPADEVALWLEERRSAWPALQAVGH